MEPKSGVDPRIAAVPDIHGHAKGEHKAFAEERPIPYTARMLFLWFFHACRRASPRFLMVADHMNYLTFEDPAAVNLVRRALKLAQAGDLYGAAETAGVELGHAAVVSEGLRKGMRYSIGAEIDNDPRCRPDAQNIVDAMKPDGMIRSVHFLAIAHPQHGENWMWPFDNPEFKDLYEVVGPANVWDIYMKTLLETIDKLPGNIVGHFYVPAKFGHWPEDALLEDYEDRFVAACAERGMAIEVNSRYFYKYYLDDDAQREKYRAVHLRLLRKAKEKGVMIAVGSDAHSPKDQGGAFETVLALLDEADINEIAFPINGRLARVALRATEEILRQHNAALAPPLVERSVGRHLPELANDEAHDVAPTAAADAQKIAVEAAEPAAAATPEVARKAPRPRPKPRAAIDAAEGVPAGDAPIAAVAAAPKKRSHKKIVLPALVPIVEAAAPSPAPTPATPAPAPGTAPTLAAVAPQPVRARAPKRVAVAKPTASKRTPKPRAAVAPKPAPAKAALKSDIGKNVVLKRAPAKAPAAKAAPTVKAALAKPARPPKTVTAKAKPLAPSAKKTLTKKAASKSLPARRPVAKKTSGRPVARPPKKAPPKRSAPPAKSVAKGAVKRRLPVKPSSAKKSVPKKPVAKKKSARSRR